MAKRRENSKKACRVKVLSSQGTPTLVFSRPMAMLRR